MNVNPAVWHIITWKDYIEGPFETYETALAELMARLGHSTHQAALRYQHQAEGRDKAIAEALSKLAIAGTEDAAPGGRVGP